MISILNLRRNNIYDKKGIWQEIKELNQEFINWASVNRQTMKSITSISAIIIEGSTLTEVGMTFLFNRGVIDRGKQLIHHLMNEDLK